MFGKKVGSVVRTIGATYSGVLIAHGAPAADVATFHSSLANILTGLGVYFGVQIWSLLQKKYGFPDE